MPATTALLAVCTALVAGAAIAMFLYGRPRLHKDRRASLLFGAPAIVPALPAAWLTSHGDGLAAGPLWSATALFVIAGAVFWPTAGHRWAQFERAFWEHVALHQRRPQPLDELADRR